MEADPARLEHRNAFNVTAMNFTPEELAAEIRSTSRSFTIDYRVDPVRQAIADSWPSRSTTARRATEWGWTPRYDLAGDDPRHAREAGDEARRA